MHLLPASAAGHRRYAVHASTELFIYGRHQQWNLGLRLYSISAKATARLTLDGVVELRNEVVTDDSGTKLRMLPYVEDADIELSGFQLHSVSHLKGGVVREFGRALRDLVERQVDRQEDKLVEPHQSKDKRQVRTLRVVARFVELAVWQSVGAATRVLTTVIRKTELQRRRRFDKSHSCPESGRSIQITTQ